jgi:hypothetical protein
MTAEATIGGIGMSALITDTIVVGTTITTTLALSRRAMGRRLRRGGGGGGITRMDGNGVAGRMVVSIVPALFVCLLCVFCVSRLDVVRWDEQENDFTTLRQLMKDFGMAMHNGESFQHGKA